jgi:hypothetical protein
MASSKLINMIAKTKAQIGLAGSFIGRPELVSRAPQPGQGEGRNPSRQQHRGA